MKKKSDKLINFIEGLHLHVINHPNYRIDTSLKSEAQMQSELRPIFQSYLTGYFEKQSYKDARAKANSSFYWEGQEKKFQLKTRSETFSSKNYPDFVFLHPYKIAIEYKKAKTGNLVKAGIGQSIMHTLCGEYDYVYFLFHDESAGSKISRSASEDNEAAIIREVRERYNVFVKIVDPNAIK